MNSSTVASSKPAGKPLRIGLWVAQVALALLFGLSGVMKLTVPIASLSLQIPWTADLPAAFVRLIGIVDLAGGLGVLLPALIRIAPRLTVLAALGCAVLQLFAMAFHVWRGELNVLPMNLLLLALSLFVLWGRAIKVPVLPRRRA